MNFGECDAKPNTKEDGKTGPFWWISCRVTPPTPSPDLFSFEMLVPAFLKVNPLYPSSDLLHTVLAVCHPVLRQDGTMLGGASGLDGDRDSAEAAQVMTAEGFALTRLPPSPCWCSGGGSGGCNSAFLASIFVRG